MDISYLSSDSQKVIKARVARISDAERRAAVEAAIEAA